MWKEEWVQGGDKEPMYNPPPPCKRGEPREGMGEPPGHLSPGAGSGFRAPRREVGDRKPGLWPFVSSIPNASSHVYPPGRRMDESPKEQKLQGEDSRC